MEVINEMNSEERKQNDLNLKTGVFLTHNSPDQRRRIYLK